MKRIVHVATTLQSQFAEVDEHGNVVQLLQTDPVVVRVMLGVADPLRDYLVQFNETLLNLRGTENET